MIFVYNQRIDLYPKEGINIDRGTALGNPFSHIPNKGMFPVDSREDAVFAYENWIRLKLENKVEPYFSQFLKLKRIYEDTGELHLVCWCKPLPCHGDIISKIIDGDEWL